MAQTTARFITESTENSVDKLGFVFIWNFDEKLVFITIFKTKS